MEEEAAEASANAPMETDSAAAAATDEESQAQASAPEPEHTSSEQAIRAVDADSSSQVHQCPVPADSSREAVQQPATAQHGRQDEAQASAESADDVIATASDMRQLSLQERTNLPSSPPAQSATHANDETRKQGTHRQSVGMALSSTAEKTCNAENEAPHAEQAPKKKPQLKRITKGRPSASAAGASTSDSTDPSTAYMTSGRLRLLSILARCIAWCSDSALQPG